MTDSIQYVTAEGLKKLEAELKDLLTVQRPKTTERIQKAKEFGDLAENAEYADAKDQQAFTEGRILELKNIIKSAVLIKSKKSDGIVRVGSRIKVKLPDKKMKEYEIVGSQEADPSKGRVSNESPMGEAFLGKKAGDSVTYTAPRGAMNCTILEVS